ncbi:MAG: hypothetical protein FJ253_10825, partial [Phycisphaerae bacterium]|nr:hypothetical protein [Phycisphaerae bacterium]
MHARTALRRRLWIGGSVCCTAAGFGLGPMIGATIGGLATALLFGTALSPSSDFYVRPIRRGDRNSRRVALT